MHAFKKPPACFQILEESKPLYRHTVWYIMSKIQDMRNDFRFRRVARRTQTKNKIDLGVHEQLMAIRLGLAEDVRNPLKIEGEDEEQMFMHNNVRIWE